jgi:hypothetical protein
MNSSITQRIKTPISAIGVSLAILLMIAALALVLTPVLPQIFSDAPHKKPTPANKTATATEERAIMATLPSPTTQVALAAPTVLAEQSAQTQDIPASPQPQTPPREAPKSIAARPVATVQVGDQHVIVGVNGTEVTVGRTTIQPVTNVVQGIITTATDKLPIKL